LIAPMIAVRMAPPAPPATNWEMMLPMLKLPDSAAANRGQRKSYDLAEHPATNQTGNNVSDRTQIEIG